MGITSYARGAIQRGCRQVWGGAYVRDPAKDVSMKADVVFRYIYAALDQDLALQRAPVVCPMACKSSADEHFATNAPSMR